MDHKVVAVVGTLLLFSCGKDSAKVEYTEKTSLSPGGTLEEVAMYKNGLLDGKAFRYFADGTKSLEYNYVDGLKEGAQFTYQHGRLFTTENYVSGKRHGWAIYYSPVTGCVTEEGEFFNDQRNGLWYTYDGLYLVEVTLYRLDSIVKSVYLNPNYEGISEYSATPASECSCGSSSVKEIK